MSFQPTSLPYVIDLRLLPNSEIMFERVRNQFDTTNAEELFNEKIVSGNFRRAKYGTYVNENGESFRISSRTEAGTAIFDLAVIFKESNLRLNTPFFVYSVTQDQGDSGELHCFMIDSKEVKLFSLPLYSTEVIRPIEGTHECIGFSRWAFRKFYLETDVGQRICMTPKQRIFHVNPRLLYPEINWSVIDD